MGKVWVEPSGERVKWNYRMIICEKSARSGRAVKDRVFLLDYEEDLRQHHPPSLCFELGWFCIEQIIQCGLYSYEFCIPTSSREGNTEFWVLGLLYNFLDECICGADWLNIRSLISKRWFIAGIILKSKQQDTARRRVRMDANNTNIFFLFSFQRPFKQNGV